MRPPRERQRPGLSNRAPPLAFTTHDLPRYGSRGAPQAFGHKLAAILATESPSVISWNESGTLFRIHDPKAMKALLGKYFRHANFSSFQRQMNLYGFKRILSGPDAGAHMHPCFVRDRPELLVNVRRATGPVALPPVSPPQLPVPKAGSSNRGKRDAAAAADERCPGAAGGSSIEEEETLVSETSAQACSEVDVKPLPSDAAVLLSGGSALPDDPSAPRFFLFDEKDLEGDAVLAFFGGCDDAELAFSSFSLEDADTGNSSSAGGSSSGSGASVSAAAAGGAAGGAVVKAELEEGDERPSSAPAKSSSIGLVEQLTSMVDTGFNSLLAGLRGERVSTGGGSSTAANGGRSGTASGRPSLDRMSAMSFDMDGDDMPEKGAQSPLDLMRGSSRDWDAFFGSAVEGIAEFFTV